jgi:lipoprotein-releasing system ATP-binding protein
LRREDAVPIVATQGLRKSYDMGPTRIEVLKGVELQIARGEIVGIIGASGAGKSTLLHLLGALDRPTAGSIFLDTQEITTLSDRELAVLRGRRIGFVFQFHHLLPEFSAIENVMLPRLVAGASKREAAREAERLLGEVGLSHRLEHRPAELSGGEQQRVAVARALVNNPVVVLADEPSGNLDGENARHLQDLLWSLRETRGQTFVIASHDPSIVRRADRVVRLVDGVVESDGKRDNSGDADARAANGASGASADGGHREVRTSS